MEERPLIIVGSGPAGTGAALRLAQLDPVLAGETLVLEKARHPRHKVCAGGLIPHSLQLLEALGVELTVPHVVCDRAAVLTPVRNVSYEGNDLCRVIRRNQFDASLAAAARRRGITIRESEKVIEVAREGAAIRLVTERGCYRTRAVIAADGSGSLLRRRLVSAARGCVGRAIMGDIPIADTDWNGFAAQRYEFNFTAVARGLRGYTWAFPCWIDGVAHVNVGIYAVDTPGARLTQLLDDAVDRMAGKRPKYEAFPIRWYHEREPLAGAGVMLAGDAAGVDPLMGEGISFALEYGRRAAEAAAAALASGDFSFAAYERDIRSSWLGKKLRRLHLGVRLFYGPTWRVWFSVAAHSRRAQEIGLRWYNGVDGWDRRSGWDALRALWSGDFAPPARTVPA
ncbi:MAG: NAD(P)/FAD-dependent oxidoreductase [Deltaproteobacteria bacterium]|nr:NAD(P)/FAD-dependent oxidoreductase [Deltaproteobacteria bacterium]